MLASGDVVRIAPNQVGETKSHMLTIVERI